MVWSAVATCAPAASGERGVKGDGLNHCVVDVSFWQAINAQETRIALLRLYGNAMSVLRLLITAA